MKKDPRSISFRRAGRNRKSIPGTVRRKQAGPATAIRRIARRGCARPWASRGALLLDPARKGPGSARSAPAEGGRALLPVRP
ncbi:hypothetical protein DDV93_16975 [Cereibacter johrii]|nr:hypothetical protein DDV93_16975 [Cereibacter johrii]